MKNWSFEVLCHKQIRNAKRGSKEKSAMKYSWWQSCQPLLEHFLEFNLCYYMSFWSSGSQQSNALNSTWFRVEMKELQSLEADHSKLKEDFARLRNQPWATKMLSFCCEISQPSCMHSCGVLLKLPYICDRHFEIFCFRYLMSKSPNSPCKSKGWITSYI